MGKEAINVKSNGLRNELKEIRKSIDKLTEVLLLHQTHKRYESKNNCNACNGDMAVCECERSIK